MHLNTHNGVLDLQNTAQRSCNEPYANARNQATTCNPQSKWGAMHGLRQRCKTLLESTKVVLGFPDPLYGWEVTRSCASEVIRMMTKHGKTQSPMEIPPTNVEPYISISSLIHVRDMAWIFLRFSRSAICSIIILRRCQRIQAVVDAAVSGRRTMRTPRESCFVVSLLHYGSFV